MTMGAFVLVIVGTRYYVFCAVLFTHNPVCAVGNCDLTQYLLNEFDLCARCCYFIDIDLSISD